MGEEAAPAWRRDIETAYELFATKHVDRLASGQILEAAFTAMRSRVGAAVGTPAFSDVAQVVPEDLTRFNAAVDELVRERPDVAPDDLRNAAVGAMANIRPDGHTQYWPVWAEADASIRDIFEGRCEVRSDLLPGGIGYIWWSAWLQSEQFDIADQLHSRIDLLLRQGARAWLFDVRGNHGGGGAGLTAARFLDGEPLYRVTFRDGRADVVHADRSLRLPKEYQLPIVLVVDSGSWSASEMFAFGLRQHGRATVIGERTPGVLGRMELSVLSGDARVGVTVAHITGPNGEMYNGVGVKPDVETTSADAVDAAARYLRASLTPS